VIITVAFDFVVTIVNIMTEDGCLMKANVKGSIQNPRQCETPGTFSGGRNQNNQTHGFVTSVT
jgi:hypothetical protein